MAVSSAALRDAIKTAWAAKGAFNAAASQAQADALKTLFAEGIAEPVAAAIDAGGSGGGTSGDVAALDARLDLAEAGIDALEGISAAARLADIEADLASFPFDVIPDGATPAEIQGVLDGLGTNGIAWAGVGTWALGSTQINLNGGKKIRGAGEDATVFTYTGAGQAFQVNSGLGIETLKAGLMDVSVDGLGLGKYGVTLGQTSAAHMTGAGTFDHVTFRGFRGAGGAGARIVFSALTEWRKCTFQSNRDGFQSLYDGTNINGATTQSFYGCRFVTNTQRGMYVDQAESWTFHDCQFEDNGWQGTRIERSANSAVPLRNIQFKDNTYWEDNSTAAPGTYPDLDFTNASTYSHLDIAVQGCRFQGTNTAGNIRLGLGGYSIEDPVFVPVGTKNIVCTNSSACNLTLRTNLDPATCVTLGTDTPAICWRQGTGAFSFLSNSGGSWVVAPTTIANDLTTSAGSDFELTTDVPSGAANIAFKLNNLANMVAGKIQSWQTAGVEKAYLLASGSFFSNAIFHGLTGVISNASGNAPVNLQGTRVAGSGLPAVRINNNPVITVAGGRLLGIYNDTTYTTLLAAFTTAGALEFRKVDISATPGAGTASSPAGFFAFAAGTGTAGIVITNTFVTAASAIICTVVSNDATAKTSYAVAAAGSFTAYLNANATGIVRVYFEVRQ